MSKDNKTSVIDKQYNWPNPQMANGSGNATHSSKLIALSIRTLGEIVHDLAKIIEQSESQRFNENYNQ